MGTTKIIRIFLASSKTLLEERLAIGDIVRQLNDDFFKYSIHIELLKYEDFDPSYKGVRNQNEYNLKIKKCDIFISLFHACAGEYTLEEFNTAIECQKQNENQTKKPDIYVYIKDIVEPDVESPELIKFRDRIDKEYGIFWIPYKNTDILGYMFKDILHQCIHALIPELSLSKPLLNQLSKSSDEVTIDNVNRLISLHKEIEGYDDAIDELKIAVDNVSSNTYLQQHLAEKIEESNQIRTQITTLEENILSKAISFIFVHQQRSSARYKYANRMLNAGDIAKSLDILNTDAIKSDIEKVALEIRKGQNVVLSYIDELILKIKSTLLNSSNLYRYTEAKLLADYCMEYAKKSFLTEIECQQLHSKIDSIFKR